MANIGQTQYYQTNFNGIKDYQALSYAGNDPYGYTPISKDAYTSGLQDYIKQYSNFTPPQGYAGPTPTAGQLATKQQELAAVQAGTGIHAAGYQDPTMVSGPKTADNVAGLYSPGYNTPNPAASDPNQINIGTADAPKYVPKDSAGAANVPNLGTQNTANAANAISTAQPSPATVNATPFTGNNPQTLAAAQASGPPPQDPGAARTAVAGITTANTPAPTTPPAPTTTPGVDAFYNSNESFQQNMADIQAYLSPPAIIQELKDQLAKITTDNTKLAGLNTDYMNIQNVMSGTADDLRKEVQSAGGFATESQVQALAVARNQTLMKQATLIQNSISTAQNAVANDTTLFNNEKDMANTQFAQRTQIYQIAQTNYTNMVNAAKDGYNTIINAVGYQGLLQSLSSQPGAVAVAEKALGLQAGGLQQLVTLQQQQANVAAITAAGGATTRYVNNGGTVIDPKTGYEYTSQQDFQQKTGMSIQDAQKKGLVGAMPISLDTQLKKAQLSKAQTDAQYAGQIDQANINQSNASAGSSAASAAKSRYELGFEQANGGMTPAEVQKQQSDIQTTTNTINGDAGDLIASMASKKISWQDAWNELKAKHPDLTTEAKDNLLQSQNYRP